MNVMSFHGGPKDGEKEEPHLGFPAPDTCSFKIGDVRHKYRRIGRCYNPENTTHVYAYSGVIPDE